MASLIMCSEALGLIHISCKSHKWGTLVVAKSCLDFLHNNVYAALALNQ